MKFLGQKTNKKPQTLGSKLLGGVKTLGTKLASDVLTNLITKRLMIK